jgi:deazaflavin-dependent oxidoreductase (nitroreductase family)
MGGSPTAPVWSHNIDTDSLVSLQDGADLQDYQARKVEGQEKADWWAIAMKVWPHFDSYQEATTRVIPLFVLDPISTERNS